MTLSRSIQPQRARRWARARTDTPSPPARAPSCAHGLPAEPARSPAIPQAKGSVGHGCPRTQIIY